MKNSFMQLPVIITVLWLSAIACNKDHTYSDIPNRGIDPADSTINNNNPNRSQVQLTLIDLGILSKNNISAFWKNYIGADMIAAGDKILFIEYFDTTKNPQTNYIEIFDTKTNQWSTANLSQGRLGYGYAYSGNRLYIAGGAGASQHGGYTQSKRVDIFDAETNSWTIDSMPQALENITGVAVGDKIIFVGGKDFGQAATYANIYNLTTHVWNSVQLEKPSLIYSAVAVGNKAYFIAGSSVPADNKVYVFDAANDSWTYSNFNRPNWKPYKCFAKGDEIYFAGGVIVRLDRDPLITNHVETWNINTNSITTSTLFEPKNIQYIAEATNKILYTGYDSNGYKNKMDIYDISSNTWLIGVLPDNIAHAQIIAINNTFYVSSSLPGNLANVHLWKLSF